MKENKNKNKHKSKGKDSKKSSQNIINIAQWCISIILTISLFHITQSFTERNSNLILDKELTNFQLITNQFSMDEISLPFDTAIKDKPYRSSIDISFDQEIEQGNIDKTYLITIEDNKITPKNFKLIKSTKEFTIRKSSANRIQVIPFILLIIDNNKNKYYQYYHIIAEANGAISSIEPSGLTVEVSLPKFIKVFFINNDQLLNNERFSDINATIQSDNLAGKSNLPVEALRINQESVLGYVAQTNKIYNQLYN
ncbi:hypothetical protein PWEIH_03591 [Listeria weihenstephanensis FSL R9-0317]|uniref:Uncharacterized protein n=1 Tax=Listeria weihenstephanensis TaxID=1006155 RepID=A0A1S7FW24_9LIST|nr:hypothetical protein [Listeria weihenstephanensis]AQY51557.1 hypothetical protein UE46_11270 [Listeria weihenstephanensis]EUJ40608.1 hypothetical protein PWEIH_03591 [Listeria weihenstephanensis FSL R9-0317]